MLIFIPGVHLSLEYSKGQNYPWLPTEQVGGRIPFALTIVALLIYMDKYRLAMHILLTYLTEH